MVAGSARAGYQAMLACTKRWPSRVWAIEGCNGLPAATPQRSSAEKLLQLGHRAG